MMETMNRTTLTEQQKMTDLLSSEKFLTGVYNTYCCEASTSAMRSSLCSLLQDEHRIQEEVFNEMNAKGWYKPEQAQEAKLNAVKQKFSQTVGV